MCRNPYIHEYSTLYSKDGKERPSWSYPVRVRMSCIGTRSTPTQSFAFLRWRVLSLRRSGVDPERTLVRSAAHPRFGSISTRETNHIIRRVGCSQLTSQKGDAIHSKTLQKTVGFNNCWYHVVKPYLYRVCCLYLTTNLFLSIQRCPAWRLLRDRAGYIIISYLVCLFYTVFVKFVFSPAAIILFPV